MARARGLMGVVVLALGNFAFAQTVVSARVSRHWLLFHGAGCGGNVLAAFRVILELSGLRHQLTLP